MINELLVHLKIFRSLSLSKYLFIRSIFIFLFISISSVIVAQEVVSPYTGSIIAGTNRRFKISFNQNHSLKARILAIENDKLIIKEGTTTNKIDRNSITNIEEIPFGSRGNVGVGFGIPYGLLGFNLELNLLPIIAVTGGIGTTIFTGVGYNVGIKGYLLKPGPVWRPRVSAYYGINGVYAEDFNLPENEKYSGVTVGLGQVIMWQQHGLDLDLMYLVSSELWNEHDGGGKIKISIGYKYAF